MIRPENIAKVMGGKAVLMQSIRSMSDLDAAVSAGLPKRALRITAERVFSVPSEIRSVIYRIVPEATYKRRTRLSSTESARTERLARVIAAAEYVWDDRDDAREWLTKPHPELRHRIPLDVAATELGARQVEDLLDRLMYGIPS